MNAAGEEENGMSENAVTVESTLKALLAAKKYSTLKDILVTMNGADIAAVFEEMEDARIPLLFRLLPKELAAETFVEMNPDLEELLIKGFSDNEPSVIRTILPVPS